MSPTNLVNVRDRFLHVPSGLLAEIAGLSITAAGLINDDPRKPVFFRVLNDPDAILEPHYMLYGELASDDWFKVLQIEAQIGDVVYILPIRNPEFKAQWGDYALTSQLVTMVSVEDGKRTVGFTFTDELGQAGTLFLDPNEYVVLGATAAHDPIDSGDITAETDLVVYVNPLLLPNEPALGATGKRANSLYEAVLGIIDENLQTISVIFDHGTPDASVDLHAKSYNYRAYFDAFTAHVEKTSVDVGVLAGDIETVQDILRTETTPLPLVFDIESYAEGATSGEVDLLAVAIDQKAQDHVERGYRALVDDTLPELRTLLQAGGGDAKVLARQIVEACDWITTFLIGVADNPSNSKVSTISTLLAKIIEVKRLSGNANMISDAFEAALGDVEELLAAKDAETFASSIKVAEGAAKDYAAAAASGAAAMPVSLGDRARILRGGYRRD